MAFPMVLMPGISSLLAFCSFFLMMFKSLDDIRGTSTAQYSTPYVPVLRVCVGWISLYFSFLFFQSATKFYAHSAAKTAARTAKKDDQAGDSVPSFTKFKYGLAGGKITLCGDRTLGNMMEQSIPFLVSLWIHAVFVAPDTAARLGWAWLVFRLIYPMCFWVGLPWLLLSTAPGYSCIFHLVLPVVEKIL